MIDIMGAANVAQSLGAPHECGPSVYDVLSLSLHDDIARAHLSVATRNALLNRGCRTIDAVLLLSEHELRSTRMLGPVGIGQVEALRAWVLKLADDAPARTALIQRMYENGDERDNTSVRFLLAEIARLSERLERAEASIRLLSTPDICGAGDDVGCEQDSWNDIVEDPNEIRKVWANRTLGEWFAARIVTKWDEEGGVEEDEIILFQTKAEALAAIVESESQRATARIEQAGE